MKKRAYNKYAEFFAIIKKMGVTKEEVIREFTAGRLDANGNPGNMITASLTDLSVGEFHELMLRLQRFNGVPPGDKMRKAIIADAYNMRWTVNMGGGTIVADMHRINGWCIKYGPFKKPLNDHNITELPLLVTVFKKVYEDFLTATK